jgi:hypothetical protein
MPNFLRKTRSKLTNNGKLSSYLLYALGEIALVVIGILLALQINNANEQRKNDAAAEHILMQIRADLAEDIEQADKNMGQYMQKDQLIREVMTGQLTAVDFEGRRAWQIGSLTASTVSMDIQSESFQSLLSINDRLSPRYDTILADLKELYIDAKLYVDLNNELVTEVVREHINWLKYNTEWFSNFYFLEGAFTSDQIDFYLNSPYYKNVLSEYFHMVVNNQYLSTLQFRAAAIEMHDELTTFLGLEDFHTYDTELYSDYLGTFTDQTDTFQVAIKEKELAIDYLEDEETELIIPIDSSRFTVESGGFYALERDSLNEVTGLTIHYNTQVYSFDRIEE